MNKVKLFISDIDGTMTDGTIYYSKNGEEMKQFNCKDGRGFYLLNSKYKITIALITSEIGGINKARYNKFYDLGTVEYFFDNSFVFKNGNKPTSKKDIVQYLCNEHKILQNEVAYIGDDTNDIEALEYVGYKACPADANYLVKKINDIIILQKNGGQGVVREFIDFLIEGEFV